MFKKMFLNSAFILLSMNFANAQVTNFNIEPGSYKGLDLNNVPCDLHVSEPYFSNFMDTYVYEVKTSFSIKSYLVPDQWVDIATNDELDNMIDEIKKNFSHIISKEYGSLGKLTSTLVPFGTAITIGVDNKGLPKYFTHGKRTLLGNDKKMCIID